MIQDIGDHTYHVEYRPVPLARDGILLSYRGREVLVKLTGEKSFTYPTYGDYDGLEANRFRWLFAEDSQQFYLADEALPEKDGFSYVNINFMRGASPRHLAFAGIVGLSLSVWYGNHRFCGHCGRPMKHSDTERMVHCDACHTMIYRSRPLWR